MARNILANLASEPTLVVAGNLHAKTEPITFDDEPSEQHPMGENVKKGIPEVASGAIEYLTGQYHNYGIKEFSASSDEKVLPDARFYRDDKGLYVFELPKAHAAIVPNPNEKI